MKTNTIILVLLLLCLSAGAQTVNLHLKNGEVVKYQASELDFVDFTVTKDSTAKDSTSVNPVFTSCPDANHPHMIDLGLPSGTKWACCNVEASAPEQYGGYFCWGETVSKTGWHNWDTYSHYIPETGQCVELGDIAGTQYDVAHVKWGGAWRMPTLAQCREFNDNCLSVWTTYNEQPGRVFTGLNGKKVFIPAAGYLWDSDSHDVDACGYLWTSTPNEENSKFAYDLYFKEEHIDYNSYGYCNRYDGRSVRPVCK